MKGRLRSTFDACIRDVRVREIEIVIMVSRKASRVCISNARDQDIELVIKVTRETTLELWKGPLLMHALEMSEFGILR